MRNLKDILDMRERTTYYLINTDEHTEILHRIDRTLRWVLNELDDLPEVPSGDDFVLSNLDD